ncbi:MULTISPECIES: hypothetical protein [unclassified Kitasatospora]|uniref:Tc toxin subunit A-related protein n=1 Tax=unclassified Kitasatospora TaxID=2633591 RepID=UPI00070FC8CB|nr:MULTISPECIES: hypothetical protein [unclassified Kitasatospora]KQV14820.1 hypothetical protein ASC99_30215 [Kitasatospora sp. Root107]KRB68175.1 hypothetical protein ASE03_30000 [Kitasatospora sp. Root187]
MPDFSAMVMRPTPVLRDRDVLLAEVGRLGSGRASDAVRASIAEIELAVQAADSEAERGAYDAALSGYRRARGLVFRLLHPEFNVSQWVRERHAVALPTGADMERSLLETGARLVSTLLPEYAESPALIKMSVGEPVDERLARYTGSGFRRESTGDELLEAAAQQAITLLADGKAGQAVPVLQEALRSASGQDATPHALASMQLNLAAALLQDGSPGPAGKAAARAARSFEDAGDQVGRAQALHTQAVGAWADGDSGTARELFVQVDEVLRERDGLLQRASASDGHHPSDGHQPVGEAGGLALRAATRKVAGDGMALRLGVDAARPAFAERPGADRADVVPTALVGRNGRSPEVLDPAREHDVHTIALRLPGRVDGWHVLPAVSPAEHKAASLPWKVAIPVGQGLAEFSVHTDPGAMTEHLSELVYAGRLTAATTADLRLVSVDAASTAAYLTHLYCYALLVRCADVQHALGRYQQAEEDYLAAAGYSFLNPGSEALSLWVRLARNALEWGHACYRAEDFTGARAQYTKLVAEDSTVPAASLLFTTAGLTAPADTARDVIAHLGDRPLPELQWEIAQHLLSALSYLVQLAEGLDFYGLLLSPIHTFEYLQSVARGFAQEAVQAEREYVNFRSRQQIEAATRRDLETMRAMARAEAQGREEQYRAAQADAAAAQRAVDLAVRRRDDAVAQRDAYAAASWTQIWSQAAATAQGMGSDSWFNEISELADKLDRGESISGERGKLAAAYTLRAGRRNREYELAKMADGIAELTAAIPVAQAQAASAQHAAKAAEIAWQAALQRVQLADAALTAFDANEFTPEAWSAMADVMRDISRDYLWRAIRIAKLMERAYNFENDAALNVIKDQYGYALANAAGSDAVLLGGDGLLADIESFTYTAITTTRRKRSRIKDVISLAAEFPAHFEQFRRTGVLAFETDLYEFDRLHPGFHQQRIEAVEVQFVGLVPEEGLNGTFAAGGVTRFRQRDGGIGQRVHQVDTMALSDFELRNDLFVYGTDTGVRGLFQGLGLGTTWELRLPRRGNNFDFARIADVQLVVYYTAEFDLGLRETVLTRPPRPGELSAVRTVNLRYDAPDAWYGFYRDSGVDFTLDPVRMPANQRDFTIESVQLRVQPRPGTDPAGMTLTVTAPGQSPVAVTSDTEGAVDLTAALPALVGTSPLGGWRLELTGGPSVTEDGVVRPDRLVSVQVGVEYSFGYPAEA